MRPILLAAVLLFIVPAVFATGDELTADERAKVLEQVERDRPANVVVETLDIAHRQVTIRGVSVNVNAVANFLENLKADPLFEQPRAGYVRVRAGSNPVQYEFEHGVTVKPPKGG
jgi:Tfp pilus assembly protein PilN